MTTSPLSIPVPIPVRSLRRNWFLPGFGLLVAIVGVFLFQADFGHSARGDSGVLGLLAIWLGSVFAVATAWRNSYPRATPAQLVATATGFDLDERSFEAGNVTEAKIVPKIGRDGTAVAVLTLRDGEQLSLWMRNDQAVALLGHLGVAVGDARASFRVSLRFRTRLALGYLIAGLPLLLFMMVEDHRNLIGVFFAWCVLGSLLALFAALLLGLVRGRLRIGVDGFTRRWLGFERFVPFADVDHLARRPGPLGRGITDTVITLRNQKRLVLRAPEQPDDEADRGVEGRALFDHVEAAFDRFQRRGLDEAQLRTMLGRSGRSDDAWFADIESLLRGGAARYRVATIEPAQVAAVVRDVASPPDVRIAAAAALVRFDPDYRPLVQRAADACAHAELQAGLAAVGEAEDEEAVKAALRRMRV